MHDRLVYPLGSNLKWAPLLFVFYAFNPEVHHNLHWGYQPSKNAHYHIVKDVRKHGRPWCITYSDL